MIAIVDYGMGNLRSVAKAVERMGGDASIVDSPDAILAAEKMILPGVGAFADAMANLRQRGLVDPIKQVIAEDRPFLGICLGLQLLFTTGYEDGVHEGLDVISGEVKHFDFTDVPSGSELAIPHMGWNRIEWDRPCPLFADVELGSHVYFVHSYHVVPTDPTVEAAYTGYGYRFTAAVQRGNLFATQFHPEKSQAVGLKMIENFVNL